MSRITADNYLREDDTVPGGGFVTGPGLEVKWQDGPVLETGENGAQIEDLLDAAIQRLDFLQNVGKGDLVGDPPGIATQGRYACRENALALISLQEALFWLNERTRARQARGVEGTRTA